MLCHFVYVIEVLLTRETGLYLFSRVKANSCQGPEALGDELVDPGLQGWGCRKSFCWWIDVSVPASIPVLLSQGDLYSIARAGRVCELTTG